MPADYGEKSKLGISDQQTEFLFVTLLKATLFFFNEGIIDIQSMKVSQEQHCSYNIHPFIKSPPTPHRSHGPSA